MGVLQVIGNVLKFVVFRPIGWIITLILYIIKNPWKIGAFIIGITLLIGIVVSFQERNISPIAKYVGGLTLGSSQAISEGIETLETQELSTYGKLKVWVGIISKIYIFFLMVYAFVWIHIQISGGATPSIASWLISLGFVVVLVNLYSALTTGQVASWLGFGGFIDLGKYLLLNKDFFVGWIDKTPYGGSNLTNATIS